MSAVVLVLGPNFNKYTEHVLPFVYEALNNHAEYQICAAAVGVVGDLSRSLLDQLAPHCDQIMTHLLNCLGVRNRRSNEIAKIGSGVSPFRMTNCIVRSSLRS